RGLDRPPAEAARPDESVANRPAEPIAVPFPCGRELRTDPGACPRSRRSDQSVAPARNGGRVQPRGSDTPARFEPRGGSPGWLPKDRDRSRFRVDRLRGRRGAQDPTAERDPRRRWTGREAARIAEVELGQVEKITADAIGEPGERTFYIQARGADGSVAVIVEKEQVRLLAGSIEQMLDAMEEETGEGPAEELMELELPFEPAFRAGRLSIAFEQERDLLL